MKNIPQTFFSQGFFEFKTGESFHFCRIQEFREGFSMFVNSLSSLPRCPPYASISEKINEGFPTSLSSTGPLSTVSLQVVFKSWRTNVPFSTFHTFVGFLSSVNPYVFIKPCGLNEGFSTFLTYVGFLPSVNPRMFIKVWGLIEGLPTFLTFKGLHDVIS